MDRIILLQEIKKLDQFMFTTSKIELGNIQYNGISDKDIVIYSVFNAPCISVHIISTKKLYNISWDQLTNDEITDLYIKTVVDKFLY